MAQYKVCIIGCGAIFPVHASVIQRLPDATLAAVADIRPERARAAADDFGCRAYADWHEMLEKERPDAVHICTPHYLHRPMAVEALRHGAHVLIEKPVALNFDEALEIAAVRDVAGKTVAVVFQNRLNDATMAAKEIVESGRYGRLTGVRGMVAWHRGEAYYRDSGWRGRFDTEGGGVLMNQSIHTLDLMQYLAGPVESLRARVDNFAHEGVIEVEDIAEAVLRFQSGAHGLFTATTACFADLPVELELCFEQAAVFLRGGRSWLLREGEELELCQPAARKTPYKNCWGDGHGRLIEHFYADLGTGRPFVSVEDGAQVLRVIDAIYRSSGSGAAAQVDRPRRIC